MGESPEFRSICTDYGKCVEARDYWKQSGDTDSEAKSEDYEYLCRVLKDEILQTLNTRQEHPDTEKHE